MTDDEVLDLILFQTAILHQPYEEQLTPKMIRELMLRFFFHVGNIVETLTGKTKKEKFTIPDAVKKQLDFAIKKKRDALK